MPLATGVIADSYNKPASGWTPISLPGLKAWYDASDASTFSYSSSTVVSQWNDKSGNAKHLTQATVASQPNRNASQNGLACVAFDGTDDLMVGSGVFPNATVNNHTYIVVCKRVSAVNNNQRSPISAGNSRPFKTSAGNFAMFAGGVVDSGVLVGNTVAHTVICKFTGSSADGISVDSKPFVTGSAGTSGSQDVNVGNSALNGENWDGNICEAIFMASQITSTDKATLESYLMLKWGLTVQSPTEIAGLVGWWDASDAASIASSGGAVSQWNDKSTQAKHVTQATTGAKPTTGSATVNGKNVLVFDGGDYLNYAGTTGLNVGAATVFIVGKETTTINYAGFFVAHNGTGHDYDNVNAFNLNTGDANEHFETSRISWARALGTGATPLAVWTGRYSSSGGMEVWKDGTLAQSFSSGSGFGIATGGWLIGGRFIGGVVDSGSRLNGQIAELIVYNSSLSDTDRVKVENYLRMKWGTP